MSDFDERSGIVACPTPWGRWWQTMEDVTVEVGVTEGTRAKDVRCDISTRNLTLNIAGVVVIQGNLYNAIQADESVWTLEDRKLIRICLIKSNPTASNCWPSLLVGQYAPDALTLDNMQKKLTLQRYQFENPGMDFSGASITGNYQGGGPELPT